MTYAYTRVSGDSQAGEGKDGLRRQQDAIQAAVRDLSAKGVCGPRVDRWFEDIGVSGKTELENRPALAELRKIVKHGDVVIVERADRLARDIMVFCFIRRDFVDKVGAKLYAADGGRSLGDITPTQKMITDIMAVIAEYERNIITGRMSAAKARLKSEGVRVDGRYPFGWHAHEKPIVIRIKEARKSGATLQTIANGLNMDGIPTRMNREWKPTTVRNVCYGTTPFVK